jgi:hypothetical protein
MTVIRTGSGQPACLPFDLRPSSSAFEERAPVIPLARRQVGVPACVHGLCPPPVATSCVTCNSFGHAMTFHSLLAMHIVSVATDHSLLAMHIVSVATDHSASTNKQENWIRYPSLSNSVIKNCGYVEDKSAELRVTTIGMWD